MEEKEVLHVGITSGSSKTAMELVVQLGHEAAFGRYTRLRVHLIDLPCNEAALEVTAIEMQLCGLMFVKDIQIHTTFECINNCDVLILLTPNPDTESDDISAYLQYYKEQGLALSYHANSSMEIVVHGDFANTHASLLLYFAPNVSPRQVTTVTSLAAIRGRSLLAAKLGVAMEKVHNIIVWGDSSPSGQIVDAKYSAYFKTQESHSGWFLTRDDEFKDGRRIGYDLEELDKKNVVKAKMLNAPKLLKNDKWLRDDFVKLIRGMHQAKSCPISQATAIVTHLRYLWNDTPPNKMTSMGIAVTGALGFYGVPTGVFFSFPVTIKDKQYSVVRGLYPLRVCMTEKLFEVATGLLQEFPLALATIVDQERERMLLDAANVVVPDDGEVEVDEDSESVKIEKRLAAMCKRVMIGFRDKDSGPEDPLPELDRELVDEAWEMFVIQGVPVKIKKMRRGSGEEIDEEGIEEGFVVEELMVDSDEEFIMVIEEDTFDEEGSLKKLNGEAHD